MFLVYNLNIITYRHDSFLFNYHATIINQLFNYHFSRFYPKQIHSKSVKNGMFSGEHKPFLSEHVTFL